MATWAAYAQLQNSTTLTIASTDHIWLNGTTYGQNVTVGSYQDSTHVSDSDDVQRDITSPVNNLKYTTSSTVSVNGASATTLSGVVSSSYPLKFVFSHGSSVETTGATFYAYDGVTDTTPISGITFQAAEAGDLTWTAANGSGSALSLDNQGAATSHTFYVAISASPSSTGAKTGSVKITLTYA